MAFLSRLLPVGLLCVGVGFATSANAGFQLFEASWSIKAFGNECSKADPSPGPFCPKNPNQATGASEFYEAYGMPQGLLCNPYQPRCPFQSTPTNGTGMFRPLGGSRSQALFCAPWLDWSGSGTTMRPAKGATVLDGNGQPRPPLYRNPKFFTKGGMPDTYSCLGTSTDGFGGPGLVQRGNPVTGMWGANTTGTQLGGFTFGPAPAVVPKTYPRGIRATGVVGEFGAIYPYVYSYTYATLRNGAGVFGPGLGPGTFAKHFAAGATIVIKEGAAKFGGTMQMLGALTTKVCYYRNGGCSLGGNNWRYEAAGHSAFTTGSGALKSAYLALYEAQYYHTALMQVSTVMVEGSRFPWTTGSVTVTATGRGPHKTIHYAHGYDNRNTTTPNGMGTIQLVTPVLTRWLQPAVNFETGGVGILRIRFVPEPRTLAVLAVGVALLGVAARIKVR